MSDTDSIELTLSNGLPLATITSPIAPITPGTGSRNEPFVYVGIEELGLNESGAYWDPEGVDPADVVTVVLNPFTMEMSLLQGGASTS